MTERRERINPPKTAPEASWRQRDRQQAHASTSVMVLAGAIWNSGDRRARLGDEG